MGLDRQRERGKLRSRGAGTSNRRSTAENPRDHRNRYTTDWSDEGRRRGVNERLGGGRLRNRDVLPVAKEGEKLGQFPGRFHGVLPVYPGPPRGKYIEMGIDI